MTEEKPVFENALCYTGKVLRQMLGNIVRTEGVADVMGGALLVTTAGSGLGVLVAAGGAFIDGDTTVDEGDYSVYNNSVAVTRTVGAADPTNPRIDQIIYRVYDSEIGDSSDVGSIEVLPGVAVGGATLANKNGAAALPNNAIRLAYILVPATFTGPFVNATHILDARTPWVIAGAPAFPYVTLTATAGTAIPNNTVTKITLATTTHLDDEFFSVSGSVITILQAGLYDISGVGVRMSNATAGARQIFVGLNGTAATAGSAYAETESVTKFSAPAAAQNVPLAVGDTLQLAAYHNTTGAPTITTTHDALTTARLTVRKVG